MMLLSSVTSSCDARDIPLQLFKRSITVKA
jgi:hypothetical protein